MNSVLTAIWGALKGANAVLSVIPALVWTIALGQVFAWGLLMHHERDAVVKAKNEAIGAKQQIEGQLAQQKADAAKLLADLTAQRNAAQTQLDSAHAAQEADSEKRRNDSKAASQALANAASKHGGRLRDPYSTGCRCSGASAQSQPAAAAASSEGHPADGSGLLSEQLTIFLREQARLADQINDAYAACRADSLSVRKALEGAP
jgi:hypothetical protein